MSFNRELKASSCTGAHSGAHVYFSPFILELQETHQGKHQICLLKADLSIYIKSPQNTMLNLLITEDYQKIASAWILFSVTKPEWSKY